MKKPIVFISHISEEREIAFALKSLVEASFVGMMEVFISSDPESIHLGQKWLGRIEDALKDCAVEIVLASPVSVRRPWINFEAGAGWIRDVPVVPLCHSGMTTDTLPNPLNTLQGATATDEDQLRMIMPVLAKALGSGIPNADFTNFIASVKSYEDTTAKNVAVSEERFIPETSGLPEHERVTLEEAADIVDTPNDTASMFALNRAVEKRGFRKLAAKLAAKMLERKNLIELKVQRDYDGDEHHFVRITDEGWLWLEMNREKLNLQLTCTPVVDQTPASDNTVPF